MNKGDFISELEQRAGVEEESGKGWLERMIRRMAGWVGVEPWRVMVPISILVAIGALVLLRSWVVGVVSLLQWGF
jgi:hypothetical protein